jgi:hypothetical protein
MSNSKCKVWPTPAVLMKIVLLIPVSFPVSRDIVYSATLRALTNGTRCARYIHQLGGAKRRLQAISMEASKLRRCEHQVGGHMTKGAGLRSKVELAQVQDPACMLGFASHTLQMTSLTRWWMMLAGSTSPTRQVVQGAPIWVLLCTSPGLQHHHWYSCTLCA